MQVEVMQTESLEMEAGNRPAALMAADADMQQVKVAVADRLKARHAVLHEYLLKIERELRELDQTWHPSR